MSTIVWISKGLFAINVTSSAQVGAQQFIFPILPPSPELHGENGIDPETSISLLRTYVLPILYYGLEILLPTGKIFMQIFLISINQLLYHMT
jgi:hypothetical protein